MFFRVVLGLPGHPSAGLRVAKTIHGSTKEVQYCDKFAIFAITQTIAWLTGLPV